MKRYVKGAGMTKFGALDKNSQELCYEAITEALEDADMSLTDIDEIVISKGESVYDGERQRLFPGVLSSILQDENIPMIRVTAACSGGGGAFWNAVHSEANNVLVVGVEKLTSALTKYVTDDFMMASERIYEQSEGLNFPAQNALVAQQYMMKYGANSNDLALVALKNHDNAFNNPKARFFGKKVTMDMIKKSPIVASPLRLFDCSISVNGAAAAIISKNKSDIEVAGYGMVTTNLSAIEREDMTSMEATVKASDAAYNMAGIKPSNVDIAELHDAFTPLELVSYEDLGFCKKGKGKDMIREGITNINGKLPVNASGGLKAKGHPVSATGVSQIYELVNQMRKRAEKRQLNNTKIGLAHNVGGAGSTATVHILKNIGG